MLNPSDYHETVQTTLERNEEDGTYWAVYEWSEISPSTAIMESVSAMAGTDPVDLEPLHRVADPDAIDRLLTEDIPGKDSGFEVSFRYGSVRVSAGRDGIVRLRPIDDTTPE